MVTMPTVQKFLLLYTYNLLIKISQFKQEKKKVFNQFFKKTRSVFNIFLRNHRTGEQYFFKALNQA